MTYIATPVVKAKILPPNSTFLPDLAYLINYVKKITASGAMLTAVQAATGIDDLRSGIAGLTVRASDQRFLDALSELLQFAYNEHMMDATDIAAFTTINTASATTDLLYGLCTQNDSRLNSAWGVQEGGHFEWLPASRPVI